MELHIKIIGWILIGLACVHVIFPKYFHWKKELATLSLVNKEMMIVHTFFIALIVFLMGLLCVSSATELQKTELGRRIMLGFGIFWLIRLIIQFFGYSSSLWKGKVFETVIHIVFSILWIYFTVIFFMVFLKD